MKILFFIRHVGYVRNFDAFLSAMAERGHRVHIAAGAGKARWLEGRQSPLERLAQQSELITYGPAPVRQDLGWSRILRDAGMGIDYLRYQEPVYEHAPKLRSRADRALSTPLRLGMRIGRADTPSGRRLIRRGLSAIERAAPPDAEIEEFIRAQAPDIVLVTPLVDFGSVQPDYIHSAKRLGVRTGLCVASWDNLTNKGLIRDAPGLVTVWNESQRKEAIELHGVDPSSVVATGAHSYDHWFTWKPSTTREEFSARAGLPADVPLLLYLCSSPFIAPDEVPFVRRWLAALRSHPDERLASAAVLIRPHPQNAKQWKNVEFTPEERAAVWPRGGADPVDSDARATYFDSIFHSSAVIGVNTSALIESAIVGRPVFTLKAPEFRETQEGTLHFDHLVNENGGLLRVASTFAEHADGLISALDGADDVARQNRQFLESFVRPNGLEVPAATCLVEVIERACSAPAPSPIRDTLGDRAVRALIDAGPAALRATASLRRAVSGRRATPLRRKKSRLRAWRRIRRFVTHSLLPGAGAVRRRALRLPPATTTPPPEVPEERQRAGLR